MTNLTYERIQSHLEQLKLRRVAECVDTYAEQAAQENWTYLDFIDHLLVEEMSSRHERDIAMKTKLAHFPLTKTLDTFDFAFQPTISEAQIRELATGRFIAKGENVLLLGPPGVGKTHLAIALGMAAIAQRQTVYFLTMVDLLEMLHRDTKHDRLNHRLRTLSKPKLLILDEMGYFPLERTAAQFLFQLVSRRYQKGSIILTSNKSFGEWGEIFSDHILATAILDRLLHFSTTLNIRGQSYRLKEKQKAGILPTMMLAETPKEVPMLTS
jgi:DNA replication protein DnaC